MNRDNRISNLPEVSLLYSNIDQLSIAPTLPTGNFDDEALFLVARSGVRNEKITYKKLKQSFVSNSVGLTGTQIISGHKTFADTCTFQDTIYLNQVIDVTQTGDISGNIFVGQTGLFENIGVGSGFANKTSEPQHTLHVVGDSFFEGNILATGDISFLGDVAIQGAAIQGGDLSITGNSFFKNGVITQGNLYLSGDYNQTGNAFIDGNVELTENLYVGEKIIHHKYEDTFIQLSDDRIDLQAGGGTKVTLSEAAEDFISFDVNTQEKARITNNGFLGINTTTPIGVLSVSGDAYIENLYVTGLAGEWKRVFPNSQDEPISFSTNLLQGVQSHKIDFPKTFDESPIVNVTLQNDLGGPIVPFIISGVSETEYHINFGSSLPNANYQVQTTARATGDSSVHKTEAQSFVSFLAGGSSTHEIIFPSSFSAPPSVSTSIETSQDSVVPYIISGVTVSSYHILFGANISAGYKVHTHAVR